MSDDFDQDDPDDGPEVVLRLTLYQAGALYARATVPTLGALWAHPANKEAGRVYVACIRAKRKLCQAIEEAGLPFAEEID